MEKKRVLKTVISSVLALTLLLGSVRVMAGALREESRKTKAAKSAAETIVQLDDSSAWEGTAGKMETVGMETTLTGEAYAAYSGLNIANELVEFKISLATASDGWFGLRFRSNEPSKAPWDNSIGYFMLIKQSGEVQLMRQNGLKLLKAGNAATAGITLDMTGKTEYKITAGAITAADNGSVRVILRIDDKTIIDYTDTDAENMTLGSGIFSVYQYGAKSSAKLSVYPNEESAVGGLVDRQAPATNTQIPLDDKWFVNNITGMAVNGGTIADMAISDSGLTVTGKGGVANNYSVTADTYSFDFSMSMLEDEVSSNGIGSSMVLFCKQNRDELNGRNATGIRFTEDGKISLVIYSGGSEKIYPSYQTGLDFNEKHHVIVEVKGNLEGEEWFADVYIYIDSITRAYKYHNNRYGPSLEPPGCFGVVNSGYNVVSRISNIRHNGTMEAYAEETESRSVYFADVIKEGEKEFLHWEWRADSPNSSYVLITTRNGKNIGKVAYPGKTFSIESLNGEYDCLYLYTVNVEGAFSEPIMVDLTKKASDLYADSLERIVVDKNTGGKAGFKLAESGKTFIPNGVNYVGIRYGDHSTFEPAYGLVPADYDPYTAEILMRTLKENGYNFIRVFIIPGGRREGNAGLGGNYNETKGIYIPYMECFTDFLTRANKYGIYVMPTMGENEMVNNSYFRSKSGGANGQAILFSKAGIQAKATFVQYFLEYLKEKDPKLLNGLFGVEMQNEFVFYANQAPFTQTSGEYTFLDGSKYDMSNDDDRRALANAALKNYYAEMKKAITEIDKDLLLCEGSYGMIAVGKNMDDCYGMRMTAGKTNPAIPMTAEEFLDTDIDFFDLHIYRYGLSGSAEDIWKVYKENMRLNTAKTQEAWKSKPIIMGEYASFSSDATEQTLEAGMAFAQSLRDAVLKDGFAGAAYWTIDTFEQETIWNLMWENGKYLPYMSLLNKDGSLRKETVE